MVAPARPGIPSGANNPPDVNAQLEALAQQWEKRDPLVAASIRQYITSGWTTPVPREVQASISALVGRQVPTFDVPRGANGQPLFNIPPQGAAPPASGYGAGPQITGSVQGASALGTSLPSIFGYTPPAGNGVWPDQPPGAGANNPGQQPYDRSGQTTSAPVGGVFPGKDTGQGGGDPFGGVVDEFGRPAGQNYANTVATDQAVLSGQRAAAAAGQAGGTRPGGGTSVNPPGFTPAPGNPTTNPAVPGATGPFGSIDPTSAIAQQGYAQAQAGDATALSAVLTQLLGKFGIDVNRGGIFTPGLVSAVAPYLKTVMEYGGLANGGKPVIPSQLADQFGAMLGGANTFGKIQDFAKGLLPAAQGLLSAPAGALADTSNQVGMVNDLLGMLTAGANPIYQQYQQGVAKKGLSDYVQSQLGGPTQNYIDWMRQNAAKIPGSDLLAQIIGATR